jgi:hypothetical protein
MPFKVRTESNLLKSLRILNIRMELTEDEQKYYLNLEKGYEGEVLFDLLTEQLQCDCLILNDLLLVFNNSLFQIDTLIIYQDVLYLIDVKNFEGNYIYTPDYFKTPLGTETKNPVHQITRSKSLLHQLLKQYGYNISVEVKLVFVNSKFTLYQTPLDQPIIHPTQLNQFMKKLNSKPSRLKHLHQKLAEKLVSLHQTDSTYLNKLPKYEYSQLRKGVSCGRCRSFSVFFKSYKIVCSDCGYEEKTISAVLRCGEELKLLFPERKITTNEIHEWCGGIVCKKRIRKILLSSYKVRGSNKWTFYE